MMKALIVDDDYFVRKCLIHTVPWQEHDIEIIGEAENGEIALGFMERSEVNLVITDLTMPIMNGFELIKQIRQKHLSTWIVVLTCHREFQHIQEAVRLGAIDYIVKTELEDDTLNKSIERVIARIRTEEDRSSVVMEQKREAAEPWALFLTPIRPGVDFEIPMRLIAPISEQRSVIVMPRQGFYVRQSDMLQPYQQEASIYSAIDHKQWVIVLIRGVRQVTEKSVVQLLTRYREERLFYEFGYDKTGYEVGWSLLETRSEADEATIALLKQQWRSFYWIYNDEAFQTMLHRVTLHRPNVKLWMDEVRSTITCWRYLDAIPGAAGWHQECEQFLFWEQWVEWLGGIRLALRHAELSEDVCIGILRAIWMISCDLRSSMNQTEVAKRVNLNRSYLSRCFKQYAGKPFQDLLNDLRVERATQLLETTNEPVYQIAEKTGFQDEKYFSKFYKQQTGKLPKQVRQI